MGNFITEHTDAFRKVGFYSKGMVYSLVGILTGMAVLGLGGDINGKKGVIHFFLELPGGQILASIVAIGLSAYSVWRYTEALNHLSELKEDKAKIGTRIRYLFSGTTYLLLAYSFIKPLLNKSTGGNSKQTGLAKVLDYDWGFYIVLVIALLVLGSALFQWYLGYTGKFMKKVDKADQDKAYMTVRRLGQAGYFSRGIVFLILTYFMTKVAFEHNANNYKGTKGAFQYLLEQPLGSILLGIVATGLFGYGIFCMYVARHTDFTTDG